MAKPTPPNGQTNILTRPPYLVIGGKCHFAIETYPSGQTDARKGQTNAFKGQNNACKGQTNVFNGQAKIPKFGAVATAPTHVKNTAENRSPGTPSVNFLKKWHNMQENGITCSKMA